MTSATIHEIPFGPKAVAQALAAVRAFARGGDPCIRADVLALIVEELMFNLVDHSDAPEGDRIELGFERTDEGVRLTLVDGGAPFDLRGARHDAPVPDRGGGAGLALVRAWSRIETYERVGARNRLQLMIPREG